MAVRRRDDDDISLFPFLSILACVIGVLTLMIVALALGQMNTGSVVQAEEFVQARRQIRRDQQAIAALEQQLAEKQSRSSGAQQQLADLRTRLKDINSRMAEARDVLRQPTEIAAPPVDAAAHRAKMDQLRASLKKVQDQIAQRTAELKDRTRPSAAPQVAIRPSGSGVGLIPTFIECNSQGLVIHGEEKKQRPIAQGAIKTDADFLAQLKRIASNPKASVIFLIRSNGLNAYETASAVADEHRARHGKLPVPGEGRIDLSLFRRE